MNLSKALIVVCMGAIPAWYGYRTLVEKQVGNLADVFVTEGERKQKLAEEKQKADEAAEAARTERATRLAQANAEAEKETVIRKAAEAQAAEANAKLIQVRTAQDAEYAREKLAQERIAADAAADRTRLEAEKTEKRERIAAALRSCSDRVSAAEAVRQRLLADQKAYLSFVEEISKVSLPPDEPIPINSKPQVILEWARLRKKNYTAAFRMLYAGEALKAGDAETLKAAKERCDTVSSADSSGGDFQASYALGQINDLYAKYLGAAESLKHSRSDLTDVIDFITGKLGNSVGDEVRRARVEETLHRAATWSEPK